MAARSKAALESRFIDALTALVGTVNSRVFYNRNTGVQPLGYRQIHRLIIIFLDRLFGEGIFVLDVDANHSVKAHPLVRYPWKKEK